MMGRAICTQPWLLAEADQRIFGETEPDQAPSREQVAQAYAAYCDEQQSQGVPRSVLVRNIHGLFQGMPGARRWRRGLSEGMTREASASEVIESALSQMQTGRAA